MSRLSRVGGRFSLRGVHVVRDYGVVLVAIALYVGLSFTSPVFATSANLKNIVDQNVDIGLIAVAGALVIIAGGFDLSAGAIYAVASIVGAKVANSHGIEASIVAALAVGMALGAVNALLCTVGRINAFVGTLATSIAFGGLAQLIANGQVVLISNTDYMKIATTDIVGFNSSTVIFAAFVLAAAFLLNRTVVGRHIFGSGGNPAAARLSGVPFNRTLAITYVISGFAAGLAGIIDLSHTLSVTGQTGSGIIFQALAVILVGGISLYGGEGAIWRVVVGLLILAGISNGFNLNGVNPLYQDVVTGCVIAVAVGVDVWIRQRPT